MYTKCKKNDIFKVMGKTIVFVNQKGGVGKTTSCINIGAYIALSGKKVLLVDFDSQGNMSSGVGVSKEKPTIYELLAGQVTSEQAIKHTPVENLDAISASIDLSGAAIELVEQENREFFLKKVLDPLKEVYDYILIDCPPALGLITLNGLVACDKIIVPMLAEFFALEGLSQLVNTIKIVKTNYNPSIDIEGILFTMFDGRLNVANEVVKEVEKYFPNKIFETKIPRNVRISEAPSHGKPVMYYDKSSKGAEYYELLGHELLHEKPEPVKKKKGLFSRKR